MIEIHKPDETIYSYPYNNVKIKRFIAGHSSLNRFII